MIKRILILLILGLGGAWAVREYVAEGVWVASASMEPTLPVGSHFFVNKLAYRNNLPLRGDIIVFQNPVDDQMGMIKRVIAVGGDTIEMRSKQVFLNGEPLSEPYAVYKRAKERLVGDNRDAIKVPEDTVYVLGDNRDESSDSSQWVDRETGQNVPFVPRKKIQGRLMIP
jgi:signal peptidase I